MEETSKTQTSADIAKEEHAECYICGFADNYEDMAFAGDDIKVLWAHRECQEDVITGKFNNL